MRALTWMCVALAATVFGAAPASAQKPSLGGEEAGGCLTSGSASLGTYFRTCTTAVGTVSAITGQSGVTNLASEGYGICTRATRAIEVGYSNFGFNAPTSSTVSSNVRTTSDGRFRLTQSFTRDTVAKELVITMTVRNLTTSVIEDVKVARFFDGDIAGSATGDRYSATDRTVFAYQDSDYLRDGIALSARTFNFDTHPEIVPFDDFVPVLSGCFGGGILPANTTPAPGDWTGWMTYFIGNLNAGATKIVKFVYRVM